MNVLLPSFPAIIWLLSSDHGDGSISVEDLADFADFGVSAQSFVEITRFTGGLCFVREPMSTCVGVSGSGAILAMRSKSPDGDVGVRADTGLARGLTSQPLVRCEPRHVGGDFANDPRVWGCGEDTLWV